MELVPQPQYYELDAFSHDLRGICGEFEVVSRAYSSRLAGHLSVCKSGDLDIARVGIDADRVQRSARHIVQDPGDHFFLILQYKGKAGILQNDTENWLTPGDMCIVDSTEPSAFAFNDGYSAQVSVHLPRAEMNHRFGRRIAGGIGIGRDDPLGLAMRSILAKLVMEDTIAESHVREAFFGVLGAYLTDRAQGQRSLNPDRELVRRSLALMSENFRNPEFTSAALADLAGVSLRRLQRAFRLIDETPHSRLQMIRTEHAYEAICARTRMGRPATVAAIAYDSGFNDLSTFYRSFKARYSSSPKAALDAMQDNVH
ncbi:helix-turn-helix domain-containing protein [uncultured Roseobacter sp.]|uniref:helix-turn-helix domain-containing protein n=1 Tax=uncultured Roseobacter sp. TaxID=114847 RepID=UPI0026290618|nr:helix-turn-helix domain-containing protein [uncultured Roseobacter sp.]